MKTNTSTIVLAYKWLLIPLVLLCGAFMRWFSISTMSTMLHHDEAWNGIDALAIIQSPHFAPFLPNNFGRESGLVYWIIPYILALGATPFAIRLAATTLGVLTLAATYRLGRELLNTQVAFWGLAVLCVFYWHVHISSLALRANLYILLGTLAGGFLLHAHRRNTYRAWVLGGICMGMLAYTYFASVGWLIYLTLAVLGVLIFDKRRRKGAILAMSLALLIWLPMVVYLIAHFDQVVARPITVATPTQQGVVFNIKQWAQAWFVKGDSNVEFNLPNRPILGSTTGFFGGLGIIALALSSRKRSGLLLIGWCVVAWIPSLLSNFPPHFLRASGMTVSIAIILGMGINMFSKILAKYLSNAVSFLICLTLLALIGVDTFRDFHHEWMHLPETFTTMEQHVNQAANYVREHTAEDVYVYFSPFNLAHPVVRFLAAGLAPRTVSAFDGHQCVVIPEHESVYVSLTQYEPGFQSRLEPWGDVHLLYQEVPSGVATPRYSIFSMVPISRSVQTSIQFDHSIEVQLLKPIPNTALPGQHVEVILGVRPLTSLEIYPSMFVHLYGTPTPYAGGVLWSQADSQICASYPAHLWRTDEMIVQIFSLPIPVDIPPGEYSIAIGIYPFPNGPRLPITSSGGNNEYDYFLLQKVLVE